MLLPYGNVALAVMIKQLAHQHPRTLIVEVGAGSGGNTGAVLEALGNRYASYTYTDISTGFFENARTVLSQHGSKLASKMLNVEDIQLCKGATVLCLGDLDNPVFRDMHPGRFRGLQNVIETAEVVVWLTSGAKEGLDPNVNIIFGLSSTLRAERLGRRLQFLYTDNPSSIDPSMLAKMLLRLVFLDPSKSDKLRLTQEPDLGPNPWPWCSTSARGHSSCMQFPLAAARETTPSLFRLKTDLWPRLPGTTFCIVGTTTKLPPKTRQSCTFS